MRGNYCDAQRDSAITKTDGFFCQACLVDKPASELSPDHRYCQWCYDFLMEEAKLVTRWKTPEWIPITPSEPLSKPIEPVLERDKSEVNGNIHTMNLSTVKRGSYKKKGLPEDYIRRLYIIGLGSKMISTKLKVEYDIYVSYKTIQRVLKGERKPGTMKG